MQVYEKFRIYQSEILKLFDQLVKALAGDAIANPVVSPICCVFNVDVKITDIRFFIRR